MFTLFNKFYLNSELKQEALRGYKQGDDAVRSDQIRQYWELCEKRKP